MRGITDLTPSHTSRSRRCPRLLDDSRTLFREPNFRSIEWELKTTHHEIVKTAREFGIPIYRNMPRRAKPPLNYRRYKRNGVNDSVSLYLSHTTEVWL
jgi:hypothetical protein